MTSARTRHLLICCKAFSTARPDAFANLTLAKIPHAILSTCEWGQDDYSLRVAGLPAASLPDAEAQSPTGEHEGAPRAENDTQEAFRRGRADAISMHQSTRRAEPCSIY